jgi:hypothetical protein
VKSGFDVFGQTRGKPADPQIYLEAAHIQDPGLEAQFVKFNYLISYLDRGSKVMIAYNYLKLVRRPKSASICSMSS